MFRSPLITGHHQTNLIDVELVHKDLTSEDLDRLRTWKATAAVYVGQGRMSQSLPKRYIADPLLRGSA